MDDYNAPLSPTALVYKVVGELMALADYLAPAQQRIVKRFCDVLLNNRSAIADATTLLPLEAALVILQVEEHANTNYEISELHKRIEELGGEIRELRNRLHDET